jgi:hypothetical protein
METSAQEQRAKAVRRRANFMGVTNLSDVRRDYSQNMGIKRSPPIR